MDEMVALEHRNEAHSGKPLGLRNWAINGDFVNLPPNGVGRYAREVTLALDEMITSRHPLAKGLNLVLITPKAGDLPLRSIESQIVDEFSSPRLPQFWVQAQLPWHVTGGLISFCNLAPVALRKQIVCIHDLHTRLMPESYPMGFRMAHRLILPILGRRAAHLTTVSEFSRQQIDHFRIAPPTKVTVTYNGCDHVNEWDAKRSRLTIPTNRPYVLCIGRRGQKYKNLELLVELAPRLDSIGVDLCMIGEISDADISKLRSPHPSGLVLLGRVNDDDFKKALAGAVCFLFPSRIEGFGLPAVEAMVANCPIVASTSPCLPEICGDAALYAGPDNLEAWLGAICKIRDDPQMRARLIRAGRQRRARYRWSGIAEIYLQLMQRLDSESRPRRSPVATT